MGPAPSTRTSSPQLDIGGLDEIDGDAEGLGEGRFVEAETGEGDGHLHRRDERLRETHRSLEPVVGPLVAEVDAAVPAVVAGAAEGPALEDDGLPDLHLRPGARLDDDARYLMPESLEITGVDGRRHEVGAADAAGPYFHAHFVVDDGARLDIVDPELERRLNQSGFHR